MSQSRTSKERPASQVMELFLSVAEELGLNRDNDLAAIADVGPESVANWRSGNVREFKPKKFQAAKANLLARLRSLRNQAGLFDGEGHLHNVEIEDGSSPADLQKQFGDRLGYDYLGHRFLYFEPQGALAWENLIKAGYEQDCWLAGVTTCARKWLSTKRASDGTLAGPIAQALRLGRGGKPRGLDVITLGPGEGGKELLFLREFLEANREHNQGTPWLGFAPVDVSIPLLLTAAKSARRLFAKETEQYGYKRRSVLPFCADFEEGQMAFIKRLPSTRASEGLRLTMILGNVLGNVRDEEVFVHKRLRRLVRPGDLLWIEVGLKPKQLTTDPLFRMTSGPPNETAGEANRRLLLEGPYRRFAAARGRSTPKLDLRIWLREDDDSTRVPGSCNFCHDLVIQEEGRVCSMLYSRRYTLQPLSRWWEGMGYSVLGIQQTADSKGRPRVAHLLLQRHS